MHCFAWLVVPVVLTFLPLPLPLAALHLAADEELIAQTKSWTIVGKDLIKEVTCKEPYKWEDPTDAEWEFAKEGELAWLAATSGLPLLLIHGGLVVVVVLLLLLLLPPLL